NSAKRLLRASLECLPCRPASTHSKRVLTKARNSVSNRRTVMKIRPLQDRLVVKRLAEEEKTKGGIIIPDAAKEKPIEGEVIAVGNGKFTDVGQQRPLDVKK